MYSIIAWIPYSLILTCAFNCLDQINILIFNKLSFIIVSNSFRLYRKCAVFYVINFLDIPTSNIIYVPKIIFLFIKLKKKCNYIVYFNQ